jgi:hypothetical protein
MIDFFSRLVPGSPRDKNRYKFQAHYGYRILYREEVKRSMENSIR